MTIRVIEQEQTDGSIKYFAYHAHIIYHDNPEADDFNPDNNHIVEIMAEIPNPVALATWRDPLPAEMTVMGRGQKVIDVICPDPMCMSVSTYPINGDPDAKALHDHYDTFIGKGVVAVPVEAVVQTGGAVLSVDTTTVVAEISAVERLRTTHQPIQPIVANAWALSDMQLPVPTLDAPDVLVTKSA